MKKSILIALFTIFLVSCGNKNTESKQAAEIDTKEQAVSMADASIVNVYYFHGKQRCKTCIAIENVTKNAVADSYKDNPNVRYVEVNIDEAQNKDLIEKYEIAFSSLLIVKPFHKSQQLIEAQEDGSMVFEIKVVINQELQREFFGYVDTIKILSPQSLGDFMAWKFRAAQERYF